MTAATAAASLGFTVAPLSVQCQWVHRTVAADGTSCSSWIKLEGRAIKIQQEILRARNAHKLLQSGVEWSGVEWSGVYSMNQVQGFKFQVAHLGT